MKRAYVLFFTLILLMLFSYLLIFIYETKNMNRLLVKEQYLYLQGKNHLEFLKSYVLKQDLKEINSILIKDDYFTLKVRVNKKEEPFKVELFVTSLKKEVSLYDSFSIK